MILLIKKVENRSIKKNKKNKKVESYPKKKKNGKLTWERNVDVGKKKCFSFFNLAKN